MANFRKIVSESQNNITNNYYSKIQTDDIILSNLPKINYSFYIDNSSIIFDNSTNTINEGRLLICTKTGTVNTITFTKGYIYKINTTTATPDETHLDELITLPNLAGKQVNITRDFFDNAGVVYSEGVYKLKADQSDIELLATKSNLDLKQNIIDNTLNTTSKTIVGAINELNSVKIVPTNDSLHRFVSVSYGSDSNNGYSFLQPFKTLQQAHNSVSASGVIDVAVGTDQNSINQASTTHNQLLITKDNLTIQSIADYPNGSKYTSQWKSWTANTVIKTGDIVSDPSTVGTLAGLSYISNSDRTTGASFNTTEKANFTINTTIPRIKHTATRGQYKGLTVRQYRAFWIENANTSGGVIQFENCEVYIYLKGTFNGGLEITGGNVIIECDASFNPSLGSYITIDSCKYVNLTHYGLIGVSITNSNYVNVAQYGLGAIGIQNNLSVQSIISTTNASAISTLYIIGNNLAYIDPTTGTTKPTLLQKSGTCDHDIRGNLGLNLVEQQVGYVLNGNSISYPKSVYNKTVTPTVNDDISKFFGVGSEWVMSNGTIFKCLSSSIGAAFWQDQNDILESVQDKGTLEQTYLLGFTDGNTLSYVGKYVTVNVADDLRSTNANNDDVFSDGRQATYKIIAGTDGDANSQLQYISSVVASSGGSGSGNVVSNETSVTSGDFVVYSNTTTIRKGTVSEIKTKLDLQNISILDATNNIIDFSTTNYKYIYKSNNALDLILDSPTDGKKVLIENSLGANITFKQTDGTVISDQNVYYYDQDTSSYQLYTFGVQNIQMFNIEYNQTENKFIIS